MGIVNKICNYSGRHRGTEHQRHKVERSEENELLKSSVPLNTSPR